MYYIYNSDLINNSNNNDKIKYKFLSYVLFFSHLVLHNLFFSPSFRLLLLTASYIWTSLSLHFSFEK